MKKPILALNDASLNINLSIRKEFNEPQLTRKKSNIVKFINKRFSKGILTTLSDLEQFVKSKKDKRVATRKLTSRVCLTGLIESINGIYLPKGQGKYVNKVNTKFLSKIKSKREKNTI